MWMPHYNANSAHKESYPRDLNWVQHWVSRIGLWANSISWVLFVSSYTTAIILPQLPGLFTKLSNNHKNEGTTDELKTFQMLSAGADLHWENSVSDGSQCIVNKRKFKMKRRRESKKSNSLTRQNNNFARVSRFFAYISFPSLHDYHVKMPNFTFCEGCKQAMTKFSFSLWAWIWLIEIQFQKISLAFDKVSEFK